MLLADARIASFEGKQLSKLSLQEIVSFNISFVATKIVHVRCLTISRRTAHAVLR